MDDAERPPRPGPVDTGTLSFYQEPLREGLDFTFKSPGTWRLLEGLYPGSGPPLSRTLLPGNKAHFHQKSYKAHRSSDPTAIPRTFKAPEPVSSTLGWVDE